MDLIMLDHIWPQPYLTHCKSITQIQPPPMNNAIVANLLSMNENNWVKRITRKHTIV